MPGTRHSSRPAAQKPSRTRGVSGPARTRIARLAVASLMLTAAGAAASSTPAEATSPRFSYIGSAYGTLASVGSTVKSGPSAPTTFGCTTDGNLHRTNTAAGLNLAPLAQTGTVSTEGDTFATPIRSASSASTAQVSLLGGLVRATAVKATSSTTRTSTGYALSSTGTTLTGLVVAGLPVKADASPNTRINVAGFGHLIVNEQIRSTNWLTVKGLRLRITQSNALGLAVGTDVTISQAVSGLAGPVAGVLNGYAYGSRATVGTVAVSGPSFTKAMPCLGTGGVVQSNVGAGVTVGTAVRTGTIANTVQGTVTGSAATGTTTSTVQGVDLLDGLVKATAVKASAGASFDGSTYTTSGTGSSFGSLSVTGHAGLGANVAPNTKVELSGVGTLYLHRVIRTTKGVEVRMMELVISSPVNGLAVGTNIKVGVARISIG